MGINQGLASYPGIQSWETFDWTDISGISPSVITMSVFPQDGFPEPDGDMVLTYNGNTITVKGCTIDSYYFQQNTGGRVATIKFLDSRWRWQYGKIDGRYNYRLPDNFVEPAHERTPQELAELCFEAMGETEFDVSALPNDARPDVDWEGANPAQELAQICDDLGCRIVPQRSTGKWVICVTGEGLDLPDGLPYQDPGAGVDPKETPDYLEIITAPMLYQVRLKLSACGKDIDQAWKDLKELSYVSDPENEETAYGLGLTPDNFANLQIGRIPQEDGTRISTREMALATVFKSWRIDVPTDDGEDIEDGGPTIYINGYDDYVTRKQIILSDHLVQSYTDVLGGNHQRPAYICGEFQSTKTQDLNYPPGTRIDYQGVKYIESPEERASFNLSLDPIDTDRSIISTSKQMRFIADHTFPRGSSGKVYQPAKLFYTCAIQIRDPDTWVPIRETRRRHIGDTSEETNVKAVIKNDIQPWIICLYDSEGEFVSQTDNSEEVDAQCDYYLDALERPFMTVDTTDRTYIGLFPIDLDGKIQQVTYRIGKNGCDTRATTGTEHNFIIPPYAERRQRDGRRNLQEKVKLMQEISDRRQALKGTFNT